MSGAGAPEILAKIKSGGEAADLATGDQWEGWLGIDTLARVMAGAPYQKLWREPQRLWTSANIGQAPASIFSRDGTRSSTTRLASSSVGASNDRPSPEREVGRRQ